MKAIFLTEPHKDYPNPLHYHQEVSFYRQCNNYEDLVTTDLSILSFDLITYWGFDEIYLYSGGEMYELKLGRNDWTEKELRESHNLFKIVTSYIFQK